MFPEIPKRRYTWTNKIAHPAWIVWYEGDPVVYFVHAKDKDKAKDVIFDRHKRVRGYTFLRARRFYELDNQKITHERLDELGYRPKNTVKGPICVCELCLGGNNGAEEGKNH